MYFNLSLTRAKKLWIAVCCAIVAFSFTACSNQNNSADASKLEFKDATELLTNIWDHENINDKPSMVFGGVGEEAIQEGPGPVDLEQTDSIKGTLNVPIELVESSTTAASVMNGIMPNDFTVSSWQLKEDANVDSIITKIEDTLKSAQWLCTFPEEYNIFVQDGFVVVVFGKTAQVQPFVEATKKVMSNAELTTGLFK